MTPPSSLVEEGVLIHAVHFNDRFGEIPCLQATNDTDMPGSTVSSTGRIFSAADQRRQRCTEVMTSTRRPPQTWPDA